MPDEILYDVFMVTCYLAMLGLRNKRHAEGLDEDEARFLAHLEEVYA